MTKNQNLKRKEGRKRRKKEGKKEEKKGGRPNPPLAPCPPKRPPTIQVPYYPTEGEGKEGKLRGGGEREKKGLGELRPSASEKKTAVITSRAEVEEETKTENGDARWNT